MSLARRYVNESTSRRARIATHNSRCYNAPQGRVWCVREDGPLENRHVCPEDSLLAMQSNKHPEKNVSATRSWSRGLVPLALLAISLLVLIASGCTEAAPANTSTPLPTPAPTSTPTPAPTATLTPTLEPAATTPLVSAMPAGTPTAKQKLVRDLMAPVPAEFETAVFMDTRAVLQDPGLRDALEQQGLLGILGPAAGPVQEQGGALVLAMGGPGAFGVLKGALDIPRFTEALKAPNTEVESEVYGEFEILKVSVKFGIFALTLPISVLDDTTAIFAVSLSPTRPGVDVVKAGLDTAQGSAPGFVDDPALARLLRRVHPGFAVVVSRNCDLPGDFPGCTGFAMSAARDDEGAAIDIAIEFAVTAEAEDAAYSLRDGLSEGPLTLMGERQIILDGRTVTIQSRAPLDEGLLAAFELAGF